MTRMHKLFGSLALAIILMGCGAANGDDAAPEKSVPASGAIPKPAPGKGLVVSENTSFRNYRTGTVAMLYPSRQYVLEVALDGSSVLLQMGDCFIRVTSEQLRDKIVELNSLTDPHCEDWQFGRYTVARDVFRDELTDTTIVQRSAVIEGLTFREKIAMKDLPDSVQWEIERSVWGEGLVAGARFGETAEIPTDSMYAPHLPALEKLEPVVISMRDNLRRIGGMKAVNAQDQAMEVAYKYQKWATWYDRLPAVSKPVAAQGIGVFAGVLAGQVDRALLDRYLLNWEYRRDIAPFDSTTIMLAWYGNWPAENPDSVVPELHASRNDAYIRGFFKRRGEVFFNGVKAGVAKAVGATPAPAVKK